MFRTGQALVLVLLTLAVAMTVGVSAIGRTTTQINTSTQSDESSQALSVAEAGIESELAGGDISLTSLVATPLINSEADDPAGTKVMLPDRLYSGDSTSLTLDPSIAYDLTFTFDNTNYVLEYIAYNSSAVMARGQYTAGVLTVPLGTNLMVLKVYSSCISACQPTLLTIDANAGLPSQGMITTSQGKVGDSVRKIELFERYPAPLPIFDNALFSANTIQ